MSDYRTASPDRYLLLKEFARENRQKATLAEQILWEALRRNSIGVKFLRQHIIGDYIADFASREGGLIIEVDGGYHSERTQAENDEIRTADLERMGYCVMRFSNEEVINETDEVIRQIESYFSR